MLFWKATQGVRVPMAGLVKQRIPERVDADPSIYQAFRRNDADLKVWLPEAVWSSLDEIATASDHSRAQWIRVELFRYIYGDVDLCRMREHAEGLFWKPLIAAEPMCSYGNDPDIRFSRRRDPDKAEIGKSTAELRLELPEQLRSDLSALAESAGTKLSSFVRALLLRITMGRHYLADPPEHDSES